MEIDERIMTAMNFFFDIAGHQEDRWCEVKRHLISHIHSELRSQFTVRDHGSKRTWMNAFEMELSRRWSALTGRPVVFKDDEGVELTQAPERVRKPDHTLRGRRGRYCKRSDVGSG